MREFDERRLLNHHLAGLISFAHHDPKKMPKFEPTKASKEPTPADNEANLAALRGYLKGIAMRRKPKG